MRIVCKAPLTVDQKIPGVTTKDLVRAEQVAIAIAIENEISQDHAEPNLTAPGQIVNRLALKICHVDDRRIVGVMKLIIEATHEVTDKTFTGCEQI